MSEFTKHSLTSIGTNKKEKQDKKVKTTVRFELHLLESNEQAYSQINYKDLLISREKRDRQKSKDGLQNGFDDGISAEDAELVRRLEEKYGNAEVGGKKKKTKRGRFENFADLGAGYDETDPFIDNTDAYDEVVPEQMTTAHGGFYINCGPLEFKQLSDQSDVEECVNKVKRRAKRVMAVLEEEDEEDAEPGLKKTKEDAGEGTSDIAKKRKLSQELQILKKKKKHAIDELTKKKPVTVKELLKEKRETTSPPADGKKSTGAESGAMTSITDAIESVVNGAMEDDASQESTVSQASKSSGGSHSSDSEVSQEADGREKSAMKEETHLPDNLPETLKELISSLQTAGKTTAEGKCKFFTMEVNRLLLGVEKICYTLPSNTRHLVYKHLESYLPCTKDTLMKRAKKLNIKNEEDKLKKLLVKLKAEIDAVMPAVLESYGKESQRVVQEKSTEEVPSDGEDKAGSAKSRIPRKVFPWTKELQCQAVGIMEGKTRCLELAKSRKESVEKSLEAFLEVAVKPLWPPGWMSVSKLLKLRNKKLATLRRPQKQVSFSPKVLVSQASPSAAATSWPQSSVTVTVTPVAAPAPSGHLPSPDGVAAPAPVHPPRPPKANGPPPADGKPGAVAGRTATVIVPNSPSKTTPAPAPVPPVPEAPHLSLPDCISVTTTAAPLPQQQAQAPVVSPPVAKPMSLKQRILHDAAIDLTNSARAAPTLDAEAKRDEADAVARLKVQRRIKRDAKESGSAAAGDPRRAEPPQPPPPPGPDKENERRLLEETNAAASYISQIICESLQSFPNASTVRGGAPAGRNSASPPAPGEAPAQKRRPQPAERRPSAADSDMSVQMEVNRVLEELKELQGLSVGRADGAGAAEATPAPPKRSSAGFQDEFQRHISQVRQEKQQHPHPHPAPPARNGGADVAPGYLKQSISSDPFAGLLFGGVQARSVLNSHYQEKPYDQSGLGVLPGISTFSSHPDDPFSLPPYAMKTDASKNQHSSPC